MSEAALVDELQGVYRTGGLLPFVGAGLSMSISWSTDSGSEQRGPSWRELVDQAAIQLGFTTPDLLRVRGEDLQILEYFRERNGGRLAPLSNWMVREFNAPDAVLQESPIIQALAGLKLCSTFYTTNFDDYLERGLSLCGRDVATVATELEVRSLLAERAKDPSVCEVVKFHGDLNHPDEMVVTESDYRKRLSLATLMDDRLKSDLLGRAVLFIGYSFRDWNVSYLFHLIEQLHGPLPGAASGHRGYITVADPSDFEVRLFRRRQIGVIPVRSGAALSEDVARVVRELSKE